MPTELPTTAIGLIAFVIGGSGWLIWRMSNQQTKTFMTYIEEKNHNLERATDKFLEKIEERDLKLADALVKQGERHQQGMDDLAARLEASLTTKRV